MDNSVVLGSVAIALSVIGTIVGYLNKTHVRSKCCGKVLEASIVIDKNVDTPEVKPADVAPSV